MSSDPIAPAALPQVPVPPTPTAAPGPTIPVAPPGAAPALANDPVSGVILQQMGQGATPAPTAAPVVGSGSAGKEGVPAGLPQSTEIPVPQAAAVETAQSNGPEAGSLAGSVEQEHRKELEPEVQEVQQKIADKKLNAPTETVVSAQTMPALPPNTVAQPVVVLPLSEQDMNAGKSKDSTNSVRWLYEWCVRQIRKFADTLVVYRDE